MRTCASSARSAWGESAAGHGIMMRLDDGSMSITCQGTLIPSKSTSSRDFSSVRQSSIPGTSRGGALVCATLSDLRYLSLFRIEHSTWESTDTLTTFRCVRAVRVDSCWTVEVMLEQSMIVFSIRRDLRLLKLQISSIPAYLEQGFLCRVSARPIST